MRERLGRGHYQNRCHAVRRFQEWADEAGHIEDFQRSGEDGESLGVLRLRCLRLDDPKPQTASSTFIRKKQTNRTGAHDQDVGIQGRVVHRVVLRIGITST